MAQHGFFNLVSSDAPSDMIAFSDAIGQGDSVSLTQLAQVGTAAGAAVAPIGHVSDASGEVKVIHANGEVGVLADGDPVFQGDVLVTGAAGTVGITLTDESVFSLSQGSSLTLAEMSFDPATGNGSLALSLDQGAIVFAGGQIAQSNPEGMVITTPSATVGVHDATGGISVNDLGYTLATMFEGNNGITGEMTLTTSAGSITANQPMMALRSLGNEFAPSAPDGLTLQDLGQDFGAAFNALPDAISSHMTPALVQEIDAALQQHLDSGGDLGGSGSGGDIVLDGGSGGDEVSQLLAGTLGLDHGASIEDILAILTGDEGGSVDAVENILNNDVTTTATATATTATVAVVDLNITCNVTQAKILGCVLTAPLNGGGGNDTICLKLSATASHISSDCVVINGGAGGDTICVDMLMNNTFYNNCVCINGDAGDDTICVCVGGSQMTHNNEFCLDGGAGNDTVCLHVCVCSGSCTCLNCFCLFGGTGSDTVCFCWEATNVAAGCLGLNSVCMQGGSGNDTVCFDLCYHDGGSTASYNCFYLQGDGGDDTVSVCVCYNNTGSHSFYKNCFCLDGGAGNDTICLGMCIGSTTNHKFSFGIQCLIGGTGTDTINVALNNVNVSCCNNYCIIGGAGGDTVNVSGQDEATGTGKNCWFFDYNATTEGSDKINGFTAANGNNVMFFRFSRAAFSGDAGADGVLDANNLVSGAGATALDTNDYWLYDSTTNKLKYDADANGAGAAVTMATMDNNVALASSNIVFDA